MNKTVSYQNINYACEQASSMLSHWPTINTNDSMPESNYNLGLLVETRAVK